jgi:hypothetical protein
MLARLPDQFDQRGPLHPRVGGGMEQEAAKVPEPDGVPPQADGVPVQGKRCGPGGEEAKGGLDVSSGERVGRHIGGSLELRATAAAIQANPSYRQPERQWRGASQTL